MIIKFLIDIVLILPSSLLTIFSLGSYFEIQSTLEDTKMSYGLVTRGVKLAYIHLILAFFCGLTCLITFCILVVDLSKLVC